jgi:hypothetical protein
MFERLLERSLLTVPGSYLGQGGEGHLRVALTPAPELVARAAELLGAEAPAESPAAAPPA